MTLLAFLGLWAWILRPVEPVVEEKLLRHVEPIGEILREQSAGQTFLAPYDGLYRIEVLLADYGRLNSGSVNLRLSSAPGDTVAPILATFSAAAIRGDVWHAVEFDPIPDSAGKTYYFQLDAPEARIGHALTAYISPEDAYPEGTAYRAGQPIAGDLIFKAHFKADVWSAAGLRLMLFKAGKPFPWDHRSLYVGLLGAYLILTAVLVRKIARSTERPLDAADDFYALEKDQQT
jgi:hypothetical protein